MNEQTARRHRSAALAGLTVGLAMALAANLTYAAPRGPVVIGLGLIAPLVLPLALYLRSTFGTDRWWQVAVREVATLAVAGPAAAISYSHTYSLVLDAGEPWILAILAPLSSDGLAGMATLALHRQHHGARRAATARGKAVAPSAKPAGIPPAESPRPESPAPEPLHAVGPTLRDRVRAEYERTARRTLAAGGSLDGIVLAQVDLRAGASKGYAKKFAPAWRAELEAEQASEAVG